MAIRSFRNQATEDINYNRDSKPARRLLPVILHMPNSLVHTIKVHPGRVLGDELAERGLTQTQLANHIGVLPKTINEICRGKRGLSAEMAVKLARALGASPGFWLNLQKNWELSQVEEKRFEHITHLAA
jgi:addiction module HigA family antidote